MGDSFSVPFILSCPHPIACEQQTYFRSSLFFHRRELEPKKPDALAGYTLDCEQSLIFLCKVTVTETQVREWRSREPR